MSEQKITSAHFLNLTKADTIRTVAWGLSLPLSIAVAIWGGRLSALGWGKRLVGSYVALNLFGRLTASLVRPGAREVSVKGRFFSFEGSLPAPRESLWGRLSFAPRLIYRLTHPLARLQIYPGSLFPSFFAMRSAWVDERQATHADTPVTVEAPYHHGTALLRGFLRERGSNTLVVAFGPNGGIAPPTLAMWDYATGKQWDTLAVDLPGHGVSEGTPDYDATMSAATRIGQVAMRMGYERLLFAGISNGGPHAAKAALEALRMEHQEGRPRVSLLLDRTYTTLAAAAAGVGCGCFAGLINTLYPYSTNGLVKDLRRQGGFDKISIAWSDHDGVVGSQGREMIDIGQPENVEGVDLTDMVNPRGHRIRHMTPVSFTDYLLFSES